MLKKLFPILLMLSIIISGCAGNGGGVNVSPPPTPEATAAPSLAATPAPTATPVPTETPAAAPDNTDDDLAMVTFKPCLAFDAIAAIGLSDGNMLHDVDGKIQEALKGIPYVGFTNFYYDVLLEHYSLTEVENMDLSTLAKVLPDCLRTDDAYGVDDETLALMKEQFIQGFAVLINMDFTSLWENNCLPLLQKNCDDSTAALKNDATIAKILTDIKKLKPGKKMDGYTVYLSYFVKGGTVSFQLSENSFFTYISSGTANSESFLGLLTHELTHSFSSEALQELYKQACETDEFLQKTKYVLFEKKRSGSYEEEFVVALSNFILFKEGLLTEKEVYDTVSNWYDGCMPIAVIVLDELMKRGDIPDDANAWISGLFENGVIKVGEIESQVDSISPGFVKRFNDKWGADVE